MKNAMISIRWIYVVILCSLFNSLPAFKSYGPFRRDVRMPHLDAACSEVVAEGVTKQRVDVYLSSCDTYRKTRSYFNNLCEAGLVKVNGKSVTKSYKVSAKDLIEFEIEDLVSENVQPEDIPLDILYEDDDIIAVNKPQGMVVHPAPGSPNGTFVNALLHHIGATKAQALLESITPDSEEGEEIDLPETPEAARAVSLKLRPGVVHRLDKGTSGVLLAGKHSEAVSKLSQLFANRQVRKTYLTICIGHPGETTINTEIARHLKNRQLMTVVQPHEERPGKNAISHVRTLAFDGKLSAALVRIETGRTHQIRVHLKHRRTPILGDEAYGNNDWNKRVAKSDAINRPLLHAYETEFIHPFNGERILLRAPIAKDMYNIISTKLEAPSINREHIQILNNDNSILYDHVPTLFACDEGYVGTGNKVTDDDMELFHSISEKESGGTGFVPSERVAFEEIPWYDQELPDELPE